MRLTSLVKYLCKGEIDMLIRFMPYHVIPYHSNFLENMGVAMCVCIAVGIIALIVRFVQRMIEEKRIGHNYQLDNVIYTIRDGKPYNSTYNFVCTKCGKIKEVSIYGLDKWMSTHMSDDETLKEKSKNIEE